MLEMIMDSFIFIFYNIHLLHCNSIYQKDHIGLVISNLAASELKNVNPYPN